MWWLQRRGRSSTTWWWPRIGTWLRTDAGSSALCPSVSWESEFLSFHGTLFLQVPRTGLQCYAVHKEILTNSCYIRSAGFPKSFPQVLAKSRKLFYPHVLVMSPPPQILSSHGSLKGPSCSPHTHNIKLSLSLYNKHTNRLSLAKVL